MPHLPFCDCDACCEAPPGSDAKPMKLPSWNELTKADPVCLCDYDCGGDPLAFFRCNKQQLCPACDTCQCCDERLATKLIEGDKLCDVCAAEGVNSGGGQRAATHCEHGMRKGDFCQACESWRLG
jgi:hypothetical protein